MKRLGLLLSCPLPLHAATAQRMGPENGWAGMHREVELMPYGEDIAGLQARIAHPGARVSGVQALENPELPVRRRRDRWRRHARRPRDRTARRRHRRRASLPARRARARAAARLRRTRLDLLVTRDGFANGDPGNDSVPGMRKRANSADPNGRHGDDLAGMRADGPHGLARLQPPLSHAAAEERPARLVLP